MNDSKTDYLNSYSQTIHNFLRQEFNIRTPIQIKVSDQLEPLARMEFNTVNSQIMYQDTKIAQPQVVLNAIIFNCDYLNQALLNKVLMHEALHFAVYKQGKQYWDNAFDFETALCKYHLPTTYENASSIGSTSESTLLLLPRDNQEVPIRIKSYI
ncbi:hypothetical protein GPK34_00795 [Secundilactobacillus kimchicus]|uniref:hypothetical protein n=1 Tax=Secundilactobacillus kimchicus TaxID=528209 RepID=UPI001C0271A0|nr:hypothetical protein [Secundilactobacillus kimchicus]MBT9670576.1 hypothetical protein [Secundilactobacillus kimchicus]